MKLIALIIKQDILQYNSMIEEKHQNKFKILREISHKSRKEKQRGQTTEPRITTILQPVEGKPHSQKRRQNEKVEDSVADEGTR